MYPLLSYPLCCSIANPHLFATPWTAADQASLSCTVSQRHLLKLMSIELAPFSSLIQDGFIFPSTLAFQDHCPLCSGFSELVPSSGWWWAFKTFPHHRGISLRTGDELLPLWAVLSPNCRWVCKTETMKKAPSWGSRDGGGGQSWSRSRAEHSTPGKGS